MTTIKTFLPVFNGFYGTYFESDNEDSEIDDINQQREAKGFEPITFDDCNFDYEDYRKTVSQQCVDIIEGKLNEVLKGKVTIENEGLISPKFYNFSNDSINVSIELNDEAYNSLMKTLKNDDQEFKEFIKEKYSSCDGFISSHSRHHTEWIEALKTKDQDLLSHKLGAALGFILEMEEYTHLDLSSDVNTFVSATNYNELIETETTD